MGTFTHSVFIQRNDTWSKHTRFGQTYFTMTLDYLLQKMYTGVLAGSVNLHTDTAIRHLGICNHALTDQGVYEMLNLYWVNFVLQLKLCTTILPTNRLARYTCSNSFLHFLEGPNLNSLFSSDSLFGLSTQVCGWGCPQLL